MIYLVFVALNGHVLAIDRKNGETVWSKVHLERGYVSLLLDGEDLFAVSSHGYVYCMDPTTGDLLWENPLEGKGTGVACIVSVGGQSSSTTSMQTSAQDAVAAKAAAEAARQVADEAAGGAAAAIAAAAGRDAQS